MGEAVTQGHRDKEKEKETDHSVIHAKTLGWRQDSKMTSVRLWGWLVAVDWE